MNPEDIVLWPCGDWCYREDLPEMTHKSDDFEIIAMDTQQHASFLHAAESLDPAEFKEFIA